MSSRQTFDKLTDELQRIYKAFLLQIVHKLENHQKEELRFYCTEFISTGDTEVLNILRSLQNAGEISWEDVSYLKEALRAVQRLDLVKTLTAFEVKRDLTILLDFYAKRRQGSELFCRPAFEKVEKMAGYLAIVMTEMARDRFDVSNADSLLVEPRKGIRKVLVDFEEEIKRELSDPWSKLTSLVVITGEIVAVALANEEFCREPEVLKLCSTAADELYSRMIKLGSWEDFCNHVEERYNQVYRQQNPISADASSFMSKKKIADVVQQLKESSFFK